MSLADASNFETLTTTTTETGESTLVARILLTVLLVVVAWGLSFATWGLPGLYLPAVAFVPVMFAGMVTFVWG